MEKDLKKKILIIQEKIICKTENTIFCFLIFHYNFKCLTIERFVWSRRQYEWEFKFCFIMKSWDHKKVTDEVLKVQHSFTICIMINKRKITKNLNMNILRCESEMIE